MIRPVRNPFLIDTVHATSPFCSASPHAFSLGGVRWPTLQHFLLGQCFAGTPFEEQIRLAPTPAAAACLARSRPVREDWAEVQAALLETGLLAKFRAHRSLANLLLSTGHRDLIEPPAGYLPGHGDGLVSKNPIGFALMQVRGRLRRCAAQKARRASEKAHGAACSA